MKILVTNNTLSWLGGSETAAYAIATELKKQGHNVSAFSPSLGFVSDLLEKQGIRCYEDLEEEKFDIVLKPKRDFNFDIIHAQHNAITDYASKYLPNIPMVYTCHGLIWKQEDRVCPEHPPFHLKQVKKWVGVSEEVVAKIKEAGHEATVIRNGIDLERFKPVKPLNEKIKKILVITNWWGSESEPAQILGDAIKDTGIEVLALGVNWSHQWDVEKVMNEVDLVISYGRGALEAMSCGRPVLIYGHNGNDGIVTKENYNEIRKNNFSGRRFKEKWNASRLKEELEKYNPELGKDSRELIEKNHDIKDIIKQYEKLYKEAINA